MENENVRIVERNMVICASLCSERVWFVLRAPRWTPFHRHEGQRAGPMPNDRAQRRPAVATLSANCGCPLTRAFDPSAPALLAVHGNGQPGVTDRLRAYFNA